MKANLLSTYLDAWLFKVGGISNPLESDKTNPENFCLTRGGRWPSSTSKAEERTEEFTFSLAFYEPFVPRQKAALREIEGYHEDKRIDNTNI